MNINNNGTVSLPDHFLHCLPMTAGNTSSHLFLQGGGMEVSVLERQRAALKLQQKQQLHLLQQQQQQQQDQGEIKGGEGQGAYSNNVFPFPPSISPLDGAQFYGGNLVICGGGDNSQPNDISALIRPIKADPGVESVWPELGGFVGAVDTRSTGVTASCNNKESSKKRKAKEKTLHHPPTPGELEDGDRFKKIKRCSAERLQDCSRCSDQQDCSNRSNGSNKDNRIRDASGCCTSKENNNSKPAATEPQKPDYIHVRARRGQATDSHSLAERVRREKISKRMKYLQDLVPGCNKITGKAGMLDEIINYVQSLQRQVEFLSMKLAAVNPGLEFNIDDFFFAKEVFAACSSNYPTTMGLSSTDMAANNSAYDIQQFNNNQTQHHQTGQQICGGFDIGGMNEVVLDMGLRRTISAPVSLPPDNLLDSSCLTQQIESCMPWDNADLRSMYALDFQ